jgi:hypothetical protein
MAAAPLTTPFTLRELEVSEHAATLLWIVSGMLLALLVVWSTGPHAAL